MIPDSHPWLLLTFVRGTGTFIQMASGVNRLVGGCGWIMTSCYCCAQGFPGCIARYMLAQGLLEVLLNFQIAPPSWNRSKAATRYILEINGAF